MIIEIKATRKVEYKKRQSQGEYDDPQLDQLLSQVPSTEILPLNEGTTTQGTSHPTNNKLSHLDNNNEQESGVESGGQ